MDPWILAFSALTVSATIFLGFWSARKSKTASDFFVAGRSVSVGWNASAISGEYLSAASFMGVAGMVMSSGYDALWYPVCYACGYLFLLLFIAGPLRRFGAYTIPDFAEGRFDSPVFRKIAVVFVLFIGFFYTMPQMKGAGTTLAYIFPGLPYWAGVVLVGAVITLNVALGGMKGITLVQAFQYWAKMFAISVPLFVLMAVHGHYGKQLESQTGASVMNQDAWSKDFIRTALDKEPYYLNGFWHVAALRLGLWKTTASRRPAQWTVEEMAANYASAQAAFGRRTTYVARSIASNSINYPGIPTPTLKQCIRVLASTLNSNGIVVQEVADRTFKFFPAANATRFAAIGVPEMRELVVRQPLPEKAPADSTWLSPFGPLTTKAAKAAAGGLAKPGTSQINTNIHPRFKLYLPPYELSIMEPPPPRAKPKELIPLAKHLLGLDHRINLLAPGRTNTTADAALQFVAIVKNWEIIRIENWDSTTIIPPISSGYAGPAVRAMVKKLYAEGIEFQHLDGNRYLPVRRAQREEYAPVIDLLKSMSPAGRLTPEEWRARYERPLALLYTYSLIIALVCGTAGLPHILVRFYTNPDGVAAKRTTMWVMILIGIFYVFPPVFGVMGRNLMPELYNGLSGVKGTDGIVLKLPTILNEMGRKGENGKGGEISSASLPPFSSANAKKRSEGIPWGSILSGVTCAGAFAAFMSTFSGLLVSMTGALAHDVYGRMLRPKSTQEQRLRAFKVCAVIIGGVAIVLGCFVEPLEINFMVGQAFAIAAASYFPLLFMSVWWRGMTMRGAATGMLSGGLCALAAVTLTNCSNLALDKGPMGKLFSGFAPMNEFWARHPLLRILCEQPAIWTVPLAIGLMIVVSKRTRQEVPGDVRIKMLVLHAPEKLGLKQEYIQEHQAH